MGADTGRVDRSGSLVVGSYNGNHRANGQAIGGLYRLSAEDIKYVYTTDINVDFICSVRINTTTTAQCCVCMYRQCCTLSVCAWMYLLTLAAPHAVAHVTSKPGQA
jgi:hypothetical protein